MPYKNQFGGISSLQNADDSDQKGRPEKVDHYPCSKKRSEKPLFFMAKYRDFGWIML
ncbi:hypothetical protein [Acinetobacter gyllenbergii]|uniref:hypothetical protein n=1 Tax=Acinetobacter gyllenbergii TaxID=134534 RepID=UPI000352C9F2|nr:hypothetical protein [Acinetobacter gyllenbergii]EPH31011.1 hypothetical protein L293_2538 [Acinetobacter gyllenbergii CIP 110306 = MTCC 11365]